jgi:hypothetical protein
MIHGEEKKDELPHANENEAKQKDTDQPAARPPVLGKLKTDEEARLAAEIEKLRGQG